MGITLKDVEKWLDEEGIKYDRVDDKLRMVYKTDQWKSVALLCNLSEDGNWLVTYTFFDSIKDDEPEEQNRKMIGLLRMNFNSFGVKFQLDDELSIGVSTEYDTVSISKDEFITGINTILEAVDQFAEEVLKVEAPPPPPEPTCESCGQPLTWIDQYKRWYCKKCKKYGPATLPPPE